MSEQLALFWESEIVKNPNGSVTLTATRPLSHMSRKQAARAISCSEWDVSRLFRLGYLKGYKPGAFRGRKDGRVSNAKLRLYLRACCCISRRGSGRRASGRRRSEESWTAKTPREISFLG